MKFIGLPSKDLSILVQIKLDKFSKLRQRVHRLRSLLWTETMDNVLESVTTLAVQNLQNLLHLKKF